MSLPVSMPSIYGNHSILTVYSGSTLRIIATETVANFRYTLPASLKWVWRKYISHQISTIPLLVTAGNTTKVAYLHLHGKYPSIKNEETFPVLLCHGDFGHPFTTLHLADIAEKKGMPTFSLYIPRIHDDEDNDVQMEFYKQAADKIESLVKSQKGVFGGILGTGHSKGSILLAQRQFIALDQRIKAVCAIAGRLNVPEENDCADALLKPIIKKIYQSILNHPNLPLVQIVPKDDWNSSQESMAVRPHDHCHHVPGMHLSGLYTKETRTVFTEFLQEFSSDL